MPTPDARSSSMVQPFNSHWYNKLPSRPVRRRQYASSAINNVWNAWSNWDNAVQGNAAGLLATMRVQADNLKQMIDASLLDAHQKPLIQQLIAETKQALDSLNPALLIQQTGRKSSPATSMLRTANEPSAISSNAKAALGCMAYLQDDNLFPGCAATYQYVRERLEQIFRLMDGEYQVSDVQDVRRQQAVQFGQQSAPMVINPDGSMTQYTQPIPGSAIAQPPSALQNQSSSPVQAISNTASGLEQTPAPSPVAGLKAKPAPWEGTPNTTAEGEETVGRGQDWFSTYGTTVEKFAERCTNWMRQNGGGQAALSAHLQANGVPANIIGQVMAYI